MPTTETGPCRADNKETSLSLRISGCVRILVWVSAVTLANATKSPRESPATTRATLTGWYCFAANVVVPLSLGLPAEEQAALEPRIQAVVERINEAPAKGERKDEKTLLREVWCPGRRNGRGSYSVMDQKPVGGAVPVPLILWNAVDA